MPLHPTIPTRAAMTRVISGQQRHPADDLERARDDLERLICGVRAGAQTHRQVHDHEEEAQRIARAILSPFRGPDARPIATPLYVSRDGLSAGW